MTKVSRYWDYAKKRDVDTLRVLLLNDKPPCHVVTHREPGDIPGCAMLPANERYEGVFPSAETCAFINETKEKKMKYFDDGRRLVYNKPDRFVTVERVDVIHPIAHAPADFRLVDGQWGYFGAKS